MSFELFPSWHAEKTQDVCAGTWEGGGGYSYIKYICAAVGLIWGGGFRKRSLTANGGWAFGAAPH